jgi:hypothetical protein
MKSYPSIQKYSKEHFGKFVWMFDKKDGSNFRVEWERRTAKKSGLHGFTKFGSRTELILNNNPFQEAVTIFESKYAEELNRILYDSVFFRNTPVVTLFGEFFGKDSFAGVHNWTKPHDLVFFDAFVFKNGFIPPSDFMNIFNKVPLQKIITTGILNSTVVSMIEKNIDFEEGIVYKGVENKKIFMGKIKTYKWLHKVRELYGEKKMLEY